MKINLVGDIENILEGCKELAEPLGIEYDKNGITLEAVCRPGPLEIIRNNDVSLIKFSDPFYFYRGLAIFVSEAGEKEDFHVVEPVRIKHVGFLLDVSRNAAPTVDTLKRFIRIAAMMGINFMMLNLEDMYPVPGTPKFGYMRGRYSAGELREVDDYAFMLGIEIIPYIQTLAHLAVALKWDELSYLRDTEDILLAESDATYDFIDSMIKSLSGIFRSGRINLGMDEAHDLGLGIYKEKHGYKPGREILAGHLARVSDIIKKYGLHGIIASDMLFSGSAQDDPITLPENIGLMYWDYDKTNADELSEMIAKHKALGRTPMYLGTVRTWESFSTSYTASFENNKVAIEACVREGVEIAATSIWMNDGAENSLLAGIPGLAFFAGQVYEPAMDAGRFRRLFKVQTGADYDTFMLLEAIDQLKVNGRPVRSNASKYLLWQDILLGLFDFHAASTDASEHYRILADEFRSALDKTGWYRPLFEMMMNLCLVLSIKAEIGVRLTKAYAARDMGVLKMISGQILPDLEMKTETLRVSCRTLWMSTLKPFGFEIPDGRFGALEARIRTTEERINNYLSGKITKVEELEEERQPFTPIEHGLPTVLTYDRIFSVGIQNGPTR